jgi:hypothetical protein
VVHGIRDGKDFEQIFPRLGTLGTEISGEGPTLTVHFTKRQGAPVHFISADDPREAAAVREVDLQRKDYMSAYQLADRVGLSRPRTLELRRALSVDDDEDCVHEFIFGSQRHKRFSDNALRRMEETIPNIDMDVIWEQHRPRRQQTCCAGDRTAQRGLEPQSPFVERCVHSQPCPRRITVTDRRLSSGLQVPE